MQQFAHFLDELRHVQDGDEPLLDRTMILLGSGMSYGHSHSNSNLPILLAGGGGLGLKHGRHIDYNRPHLKGDYTLSYGEWRSLCGKPKDGDARLSNVLLTMLQKMDVNVDRVRRQSSVRSAKSRERRTIEHGLELAIFDESRCRSCVAHGRTPVRSGPRDARSAPGRVRRRPPTFPPVDSTKGIHGELVSADFIHRTGEFRTATGELMPFTMPPYAIMTYRGVESDLRDVPLGTEMEFLLLPGESGEPMQLVATKHGDRPDDVQRTKFLDFTKARGLAGWIDRTDGHSLTVTFFSGMPDDFTATWGDDFGEGQDVRVCVANDELRTWNPTSTGEKGTIVAAQAVPVTGDRLQRLARRDRSESHVGGFSAGTRGPRLRTGLEGAEHALRGMPRQLRVSVPQQSAPESGFSRMPCEALPRAVPVSNRSRQSAPAVVPSRRRGNRLPMHSEHRMLGELTRRTMTRRRAASSRPNSRR